MEQEMEVLYIEDLASHGGPESCVGDPRGRSEALTGVVRAGLLSREIKMKFGVPTSSPKRKATSLAALSRVAGEPRAVEEPGHARKSPCTGTGRSHGRPWAFDDAPSGMVRGVADRRLAGRGGNAVSVIPR
jgi:hypothetical protein